jgi:hypothetical protein
MPYTDEQWIYYSDWKNYTPEKDIQYSKEQFDFFLNKLKNNEPFSIVRFGEGESRIVLKEQKLNRRELSYDPSIEKDKPYVKDLENVAKINHQNYYVGIQSYTFKPGERDRPFDEFIIQRNYVKSLGNLPLERYTCSRIFCNFYERCQTELLPIIRELKRDVYYVSCVGSFPEKLELNIKKSWKIDQRDAWKNNINLYEEIKEEINSNNNALLICSAGFFGNILISKMNHDNNILINIGSVYDPIILGKKTRGYQRKNETRLA